jgi:hypothetical protein
MIVINVVTAGSVIDTIRGFFEPVIYALSLPRKFHALGSTSSHNKALNIILTTAVHCFIKQLIERLRLVLTSSSL